MTKASRKEFIGLMACIMSISALSIDAMMPGLSQIGVSLEVQNPNDIQFIISSVLLGMAFGLPLYGPFSDAFGRMKALYLGLSIFLFGSTVSVMATNFETMIVGRLLQGFGTASCRISSVAMIRDRFEGPEMGQVMSFIMIIFILVPAIAPSIGQVILLISGWRYIFGLFIAQGLLAALWLKYRQEETLPPSKRLPFSLRTIWSGTRETLSHRVTRGYTIAAGLMFGALVAYLSTAQQLLQEQYEMGETFALAFGAIAIGIGISSYLNAKLVMKYRMEQICVFSLYMFAGLSGAFYLYIKIIDGLPSLNLLLGFLMATLFFLGMIFSNFGTLAMLPHGHIAGVASSVISAVQTFISVLLGGYIGYLYDATPEPLVLGFFVISTLSVIVTIKVSGHGLRSKVNDLA